jgi:hypothetical protein
LPAATHQKLNARILSNSHNGSRTFLTVKRQVSIARFADELQQAGRKNRKVEFTRLCELSLPKIDNGVC